MHRGLAEETTRRGSVTRPCEETRRRGGALRVRGEIGWMCPSSARQQVGRPSGGIHTGSVRDPVGARYGRVFRAPSDTPWSDLDPPDPSRRPRRHAPPARNVRRGWHRGRPGRRRDLRVAGSSERRLPALGGLASGLITFTFASARKGHGTDATIDALHHHEGEHHRDGRFGWARGPHRADWVGIRLGRRSYVRGFPGGARCPHAACLAGHARSPRSHTGAVWIAAPHRTTGIFFRWNRDLLRSSWALVRRNPLRLPPPGPRVWVRRRAGRCRHPN